MRKFSFILFFIFALCSLPFAVFAQDIKQLEQGEAGGMAKYKEWLKEQEKDVSKVQPFLEEKPQINRTEVISGKPEEISKEVTAKEEEMPTISMDFQDANMKDVLKIFSQQSGLNFIAGENIKDSKITLYLDKVSVEDALNTILKGNNLTYEQAPDSNIFIVKQTAEPVIETITKVFTLNYAQVEEEDEEDGDGEEEGHDMQEVIENILTEHGKVICYGRTNSLIVTDIPANFARIEKTIKEIDTPTPQVVIEAEILETVAGLTDQLGIDWTTTLTWTAPSSDLMKSVFHGAKFPAATLSASRTQAILDLLLTDTRTKYLAKPKVCVLNNEEAVIDITRDMVVGVTTTYDEEGNPTGEEIKRMDIGTKLTVTPHINPKDEITLILEPEVSRATKSSLGNYMDKLQRKVSTRVLVKDGNTVIIGGLLSHSDVGTKKKVHFFGDIPLLGNLFRYETKTKEQTEIVIFITPHIVRYWEETPTTTAFPAEEKGGSLGSGGAEEEILQLEPITVN
ncbi:secretin and TonB N-terminal domain-containing protein [Candidatus Aerophobetes bacterium]|nr:secretin and TonB N-terminal domain-containing protein [Candidatus Aerophobetes bacterium]